MTRQFRVGEWLADPSLDELRRGGTATKIEPRMMRLLCLLADRRGEVVATNEILDKVWTGVVVSSNSVYQAIAQLRRHLGDDEGTPRYIVTVPRKGYRLIADVAPETSADARVDDAAAGARPEPVRSPLPPSSPETSPATRRRPSVGMLLAGAAVVAIALAAVWMFRPNAPGERDAAAPAAVAVLQFADLSVGGVNEDFCAGLTDELLNSIARLPGVRVTGRTSSARYRSNREDAREIGRALGVTHVLEGSVRRSGSRVRINAQLVSTRDGFHVWSNSFDRPVSDVLGIQADIARAVADALAVQLSPAARQRLSEPVTKHVNAYDLYLLG